MVKGAMEQLRLQAIDWGIRANRTRMALLSTYAELLANYELANVIGTKHWDKIVLDHLVDALSCFAIEDLHRRSSLIDVGTGAGLPGIPLAIARPELHVTMLESTGKKVRFLKHTCAKLNLRNSRIVHDRAENSGRQSIYREAFDIATARALASLPVLLEYCAPLVCVGGVIVAMKGRLQEEELSKGAVASRELGLVLREVKEVKYLEQLPEKERQLVIFDKVGSIPDRFPREPGSAKKRSLGS
jgi:16S rRNA (guanine527-N7)-methyltransferase